MSNYPGWQTGQAYLVNVAPGWLFTGVLSEVYDDPSREERTLCFQRAAWVQELGPVGEFFRLQKESAAGELRFPPGFHAEMICGDDDPPLLIGRHTVIWWRAIGFVPEQSTTGRGPR